MAGTKKSKKKSTQQEKAYCIACQKEHAISEFYQSCNPMHTNGLIPYCKKWIKQAVRDEDGEINLNTLKDVLRQLDLPFLKDYWESACKGREETVGRYFKDLKLKQNRNLTWKDSIFENIKTSNNDDANLIDNVSEQEFNVTTDMIKKWGNGFTPTQISQLEDLYDGMDRCFDIENRSQEEYLKTACLYQMRNIEAIQSGNSNEAKKWGDLFDSYMASGKLKPNQMSESDRMGGITNFSNFFKFVEKTSGFTPVFPDLILDDIDYAIYMFINYNRELLGQQKIELGEVKDFMNYDYIQGQEIKFPSLEEEDEENGI